MRAALLTSLLLLAAVTTPALAQSHDGHGGSASTTGEALENLRHETGGQRQFVFSTDRFEYRTSDGEDEFLWDVDAWYGGRLNKLWIKSEAEYDRDEGAFHEAEIQLLWSRAITSYFDVQAGLRHDFAPGGNRTHAVAGLQGLAPYWFEIDAAAFLSNEGELTAAIEAEYDLLLTQRLILQPRAEVGFSAQDMPDLETGAGLTGIEAGLRLRYEIVRQFAPYIGVEWTRSLGETADYARAAGEDVESTALVFGLRVWF
ncbi:copper resistance protein B [Hyphobacterium marinum]|uniref:Copper resistance protein B n=1 Tax=Hyphobacterium marinum TaxID=3116574 RepID=A0ABU7LU25_9PROT|nr:copper resistance protein B [Hyphobacterium sp. Y6023]MEE2565062.1 copper resistance protein B [Hyphobacterium sp. Y6023]